MNNINRLLFLAGMFTVSIQAAEGKDRFSWLDYLHPTATANSSWNNNISRTAYEASRKDAQAFEFSLSSSVPRQLAPSLLLITKGEISAQHVSKYELSDLQKAGGSLTLQKKFGLGPHAPVLQFHMGTSYKLSRLTDDRGWTSDAGMQLAKRVLPNVRVAAGLQWIEHNAESATFDFHQFTYNASVNWDINHRWSLAGQVGRLEGDVVANAAWPIWGQAISGGYGPVVRQAYTSRPWTVTNVYGTGWVAYNIEADVDLWSAILAYAISAHTAIALEKSAAYVVNSIGVSYPTDSWSLRLSHRF